MFAIQIDLCSFGGMVINKSFILLSLPLFIFYIFFCWNCFLYRYFKWALCACVFIALIKLKCDDKIVVGFFFHNMIKDLYFTILQSVLWRE